MNDVPFKDNKIIITIRDGQLSCNAKEPISFEDLLSAFCTVMLGSMNKVLAKTDNKEEAKGAIYDSFNCMVSGVLEKFAPEYELRPGLTAKAILEAENRIIKEGRLHEVEPHS